MPPLLASERHVPRLACRHGTWISHCIPQGAWDLTTPVITKARIRFISIWHMLRGLLSLRSCYCLPHIDKFPTDLRVQRRGIALVDKIRNTSGEIGCRSTRRRHTMPLSYSAAARGAGGASNGGGGASAPAYEDAPGTKASQQAQPALQTQPLPRQQQQSPSQSTAQHPPSSSHDKGRDHGRNHNSAAQHATSPPTSTETQDGSYTAATYTRREAYKAKGAGQDSEDVYVLTLLESKAHHDAVTAQRAAHFPPKINKLAAHIALFRALPAAQRERIDGDIARLAARTRPFEIATSNAFRMRQGVGVGVGEGSREARRVWEGLKSQWEGEDWLSEQDAGGFRAHYTVQNKVGDEQVVKKSLDEVSRWCEGGGSRGKVEGLVLWRYDRGWWRHEKDWRFPGA